MEAKVTWKSGLSFTGAADTGFTLPLGGSRELGGEEDGFRPMELIALSLAACTAMDVISILQKMRQQVTAFEVQAHVERASQHPKVFTHAVLEYSVTGENVEETSVARAIALSATRYCPAHAMLSKVFPIELKYHIYEAGVGEIKEWVKSGVCTTEASLA